MARMALIIRSSGVVSQIPDAIIYTHQVLKGRNKDGIGMSYKVNNRE